MISFVLIQSGEEFVVAALVDLPQLDENAGADVQFSGFVFGVGRSANITAPALEFRAQLFLRKPALFAQSLQIATHIAVPSDFLLHSLTSVTD